MKSFLLPFLFLASAFFSATETALFALRRVDLLRWKEEGERRGALIERLLSRPGRLIATILIGNEIVNVAISSVLAAMLLPLYPRYGEVLALALGTVGILILGDITPKSIVWPRAKTFSLRVAAPIQAFSRAAAPLLTVMEWLSERILRLLGSGSTPETREAISEAEFRALVDVGEESGTLDPGEKELIHNIFEMTDRRAGEIMTPLPDVFMVPRDLPYGELIDRYRRYRKSRIPVYEGERSNVAGILHFKDLLRSTAEGMDPSAWRTLVRPSFVVPTAKKLPLLLREFQRRKVHIALIVDELGEPAGIVTLEDVLEELFGDIREEHDREEKEIAARTDGSHLVLGKTPVRRLNEAFGTKFPDRDRETVEDLLLHEFGRLPRGGDRIVLSGFSFTVERLKGIRIVEVGVRPMPGEPA
ncbi:MAG: HlyC/CorC family transporter [Deltaproteobacteria bacterium]|nr:HlyC/CorC family transporter [Deltaproteobacteria bacterium]